MVPAIDISDLSVSFRVHGQTVTALDKLSLTVEAGNVCGFLGPNGAGKTTTIQVLLGFLEPDSGVANVFGDNTRHSLARQRIGYLPENPDMYRFLTGQELLRMTGRLFGISGASLGERIDTVLQMVELDAAAARRRVGTYSRGMLQRIGIAQALINDPELLILDEPTSGMDPIGRRKMRDLIDQLRRAGKTVFFSSHELSEVELVCDHVVVVANGKMLAAGAANELADAGESLEQYFLRICGC